MIFGFDTEDLAHARAALIIYAIYRSREPNSSLNGVDTWKRVVDYARSCAERAGNIREFVDGFAAKAGTRAIRRKYLDIGGPVAVDNNTLVEMDGVYNVDLSLFEDDAILAILRNESQYIRLLVSGRIEQEKLAEKMGVADDDDN